MTRTARPTPSAPFLATRPDGWRSESCDPDGQQVNPSNGSTTEGKTGLMRCRDGEGGPVVREQELKNGVFMGAVRYYKDGVSSASTASTSAATATARRASGSARQRRRQARAGEEETLRDGRTVGLARSWYPSGQLRRVAFHDDEEGAGERRIHAARPARRAALRRRSRARQRRRRSRRLGFASRPART